MTSRLPLSIAILLVLLVPGGVGDAAGAHPQELQAGSGRLDILLSSVGAARGDRASGRLQLRRSGASKHALSFFRHAGGSNPVGVAEPWKGALPAMRGGYRVSEIIKHYVLLMTPCPGNETSGEELLAAVNAAESSLASSLALATEEDAGATSEVPSTAISDPERVAAADSAPRLSTTPTTPTTPTTSTASSLLSAEVAAAMHTYGIWLYHNGNSSGAENYFRKALATDAGCIAAAADYACILHRLRHEEEKALDIYETILLQEPGHVQTLCNCAWLYYSHKNDAERAEAYLETALSREPGNPDANHMFARIQDEVHSKHDEAEAIYKQTLELFPEHVDTLYSYGNFALDRRDDRELAAEMYRRGLAVDPVFLNDWEMPPEGEEEERDRNPREAGTRDP